MAIDGTHQVLLKDLENNKVSNQHTTKILKKSKKNNSLLPVTEIVDQYYGDVQKLGGNRWDTSSLIKRLRK